MQTRLKCVVTGRVQGVFYRASTAERAEDLGLDGWVRNRSDGRVELVIQGAADAVEVMVAWLWQGPQAAEVNAVELQEWEGEVEPGFRVVR
jgi:acylphosphatase